MRASMFVVLCSIAITGVLAAAAAPPVRTPGVPSRSAGAHRLRLEHLLPLCSFSEPTWSADGRRLAFVVNAPDTAENTTNADLWLLDVDRGELQRLTRHPKADVSPTFSPSGDTLAFASFRPDDGRPTIYLMSLRGGEPWTIASFDESVGEVKWSPDGRMLAFVKQDTLPSVVRERRKRRWDPVVEDERLSYPQLWVMDLATGKQRRLTSGESYVWYVRWSPDSRRIAFLWSPTGKADDSNRQDVGVVAVEGGPMRKLGVIGAEYVWSPDGRWIACATGIERDQHIQKSDLWIVPIADVGRPIDLTAGFDEDAGTPAWSAGSDTLFFHAAQGVTMVVASVAMPHAGATPRVELSIDRAAEAGAPVGARSGRVAWIQSSPRAPDEIWIADHPRLAGRAATAFNAEVAGLDLGTTRAFEWTSTDGVRVGGLVLRPPGAPERRPLKTLVALHGGPYGRRYALGFQDEPQYFAANGYQVFMPNFRSSGGSGTAFMLRQRADWGGQDWRDVTTGLDSLVKAGLADATRLGVFGRSYGGYLSAWAVTQTNRFDAACVITGAVDLEALYGQSDAYTWRAYDFGGPPWEADEAFRRSSPIHHIRNVRTPTMIQVGENDPRIPLAQAQQFYRALTTLGVPAELVRYPREGHLLREPRHRADHLQRMLGWFDRWIR